MSSGKYEMPLNKGRDAPSRGLVKEESIEETRLSMKLKKAYRILI